MGDSARLYNHAGVWSVEFLQVYSVAVDCTADLAATATILFRPEQDNEFCNELTASLMLRLGQC